MSSQTEPPSTATGTAPSLSLTPAEIAAVIVPGLVGMAAVGLIAMVMLL